MKILVTGGCGFIGSNFIDICLQNPKITELINLDALFVGSHKQNLQHIKSKRYKFVKGNICNRSLLSKLLKKVDYVVNFAAESHVDRSISNSKDFLTSNVIGVHTILEELRNNSHVKMIHISTDEVFGDILKGTFYENDSFNPSSPYAATKAAAEMLVKSFIRTYDLDVTITRCVNNYGPRQFPEKLIPKIILFALLDKPIPVYGDGMAQRQWIHVNDHCNVILQIIKKSKSKKIYNIPGNYEISNIRLVKKILKLLNKPTDLISYVDERPGHDKRYSISSKIIKKELGFFHQMKFDQGLKLTVDWYIKNRKWWAPFLEHKQN